ncbi:PDZ domain-containing protein [Microcoleus sp. FACHB-68]|uniref:PDZ domain-containing protein n=1 Tax=Microcoleus sp. FACHB-68 TaxID=2692826 RepID=UPI00168596AB|nr:PDZ domain-containing protein [Microcoleus sp. FACHB-68]
MLTLTPARQQEINQDSKSGIRITTGQGVLISSVGADSPTALAGLRAGDIILKINNQPLLKQETLLKIIQNSFVGSTLQIELNRNGQMLNLAVRVGRLPDFSKP